MTSADQSRATPLRVDPNSPGDVLNSEGGCVVYAAEPAMAKLIVEAVNAYGPPDIDSERAERDMLGAAWKAERKMLNDAKATNAKLRAALEAVAWTAELEATNAKLRAALEAIVADTATLTAWLDETGMGGAEHNKAADIYKRARAALEGKGDA
jgi:hypothetical protein